MQRWADACSNHYCISSDLTNPPFSTRAYLEQHNVAIVCSARSGSTKALGTTNLLLRAATEALQRNCNGSMSSTAGLATPQMPVVTSIAHSNGFWGGHRSSNGGQGTNGNGTSSGSRESLWDSPAGIQSHAPLTSGNTLTPLVEASSPLSLPQTEAGTCSYLPEPSVQKFQSTVDMLRVDHISAARAAVRDGEMLKELEGEIERDCEGLRSFLFAAHVR